MWIKETDFYENRYSEGVVKEKDSNVYLKVVESNLKCYPVGKIIKVQKEFVIDCCYKIYYFHDGSHRTVFFDHSIGMMIDTKPGNYVRLVKADKKDGQIEGLEKTVEKLKKQIEELKENNCTVA